MPPWVADEPGGGRTASPVSALPLFPRSLSDLADPVGNLSFFHSNTVNFFRQCKCFVSFPILLLALRKTEALYWGRV